MGPTIKQQSAKNAHNASIYASAVTNNPTVQNRLNVLNQHQIQQQKQQGNNKSSYRHSMGGMAQYSNSKQKHYQQTQHKNRNLLPSQQQNKQLKRRSIANTSAKTKQNIQKLRAAQKEQARQRQRSINNDDCKQPATPETILENEIVTKPKSKQRKPK